MQVNLNNNVAHPSSQNTGSLFSSKNLFKLFALSTLALQGRGAHSSNIPDIKHDENLCRAYAEGKYYFTEDPGEEIRREYANAVCSAAHIASASTHEQEQRKSFFTRLFSTPANYEDEAYVKAKCYGAHAGYSSDPALKKNTEVACAQTLGEETFREIKEEACAGALFINDKNPCSRETNMQRFCSKGSPDTYDFELADFCREQEKQQVNPLDDTKAFCSAFLDATMRAELSEAPFSHEYCDLNNLPKVKCEGIEAASSKEGVTDALKKCKRAFSKTDWKKMKKEACKQALSSNPSHPCLSEHASLSTYCIPVEDPNFCALPRGRAMEKDKFALLAERRAGFINSGERWEDVLRRESQPPNLEQEEASSEIFMSGPVNTTNYSWSLRDPDAVLFAGRRNHSIVDQ